MDAQVPLRFRVSNPPAVFVGRETERKWLAQMLSRGALAIVVGGGGMGKTSLVLETLREGGAALEEGARMVRLVADDPLSQVLSEIARAFGSKLARTSFEATNEDELEQVLDLAEERHALVFLDDLHHLPVEDQRFVLARVAAHARVSRWIVTSRMDPQIPGLIPHVLRLRGMPQDALTELAQSSQPQCSAAQTRQAVANAGGNPWALLQYLASGPEALQQSREALLDSLEPTGLELLRALSLLRVPLPREALASITAVIDDSSLSTLERRGLVQRTPAGYLAHDVLRTLMQDTTDAAYLATAAGALCALPLPEAVIEGVRLHIVSGDVAGASAVLEQRGDALLSDGYAPRLWAVLGDASDPRLDSFRIRCAAELGNPTALDRVRGSTPASDLGARLAWARAQLAHGRVETTRKAAADLCQSAAGSSDPRLRADTTLLLASCMRRQGRFREASELLAGLAVAAPALVDRRDAAMFRIAAQLGELTGAELRAARHRFTGSQLTLDGLEEMAFGMCDAGAFDDAAAFLGRLDALPRASSATHLEARVILLLKARLALREGRVADGLQLVEELTPFDRGESLIRPELSLLRAELAMTVGELSNLDEVLAQVTAVTATSDIAIAQRATARQLELATLRAETLQPTIADGFVGYEARLRKHVQDARWGRLSDDDLQWVRRVEAAPHLSPLSRLVQAYASAAQGQAETAVTTAMAAMEAAAKIGNLPEQAEAIGAVCELRLLVGDFSRASRWATELEQLAPELRSARYALVARFVQCVSADGPVDVATLELAAASRLVAADIARRSQALLGGAPALDAIEAATLAQPHLSAIRDSIETVSEAPGPGWERGWCIDQALSRVVYDDGRTVDLGRRPQLFRVLDLLCDHRGQATKEQIVLGVWEEKEYHPLKHKNRLVVALRKLRELLEDDPSRPTRILTTEDGYALGGMVRRRNAARR